MELTPQEKSRVWWSGTIKGAVKGLLVGLAIGAVSALVLQFALIPLLPALGLPSIAEAFAGFLTLSPASAATWAGGVVPLSAFSMIPLAIFSGVSAMIGNAFASGNQAVAAYQEEKTHLLQAVKINQLEGREQMVEQTVARSFAPSHNLQAGLSDTPRTSISAADAQISRLQNAPSSLSLH